MNKTTDNKTILYKGYTGSIEVSVEDSCLHGRVLFIDDIITYEGVTVADLAAAFEGAVDRYVTYCKETGKAANKPYSGTFNVRVGPQLHRKAAQKAYALGINLNVFVTKAIKVATEQDNLIKVEHTHNHRIVVTQSNIAEILLATTKKPEAWEKVHVTQ